MAYDLEIENRIHEMIARWRHTDEKKMFGGICHLMNGNMFCGVYKDYLILRLGEKQADEALEQPAVRPFDITGRPMKGWVMVSKAGIKNDSALKQWLEKAKRFVKTLPIK